MTLTVDLGSYEVTTKLLGAYDRNLALLESAFSVRITNRGSSGSSGDCLTIEGEEEGVSLAARAIAALKQMAKLEDELPEQKVNYVISTLREGRGEELSEFDERTLCLTAAGKPVRARTVGQQRYAAALRKHTLVLAVGPAGTGKTFLAVAMAVTALRRREVSRIVLTRPAVEAGERLGYLPGDLQSKIEPYLRPLYDALYDLLGAETYARLSERGTIEVAPLAYMRGRTLDDAYIILDEAQNTTPEQMKMFLTRLGEGSKAVVTGDLTQTDLPSGVRSGLRQAIDLLEGIEDIAVHRFTERDVVRHRLVQKIILAYDKVEREARAREKPSSPRPPAREK